MILQPQHDHLRDYDNALAAMGANDENLDLKHKAVLALVRSGSLEFAQTEYYRYGLDKVRGHEDIMALGGRLFKDLALVNIGKMRSEYAKQSANLYEKAFQDSGGYYSGINAGTMSLLANVKPQIIQERAHAILQKLPASNMLDKETLYFIEATRAEGHLLLGHQDLAEKSLRKAVEHDPLNYTAHASTLKQFRMILDKRGEDATWLDPFTPPKTVHFAGHMFATTKQARSDIPVLNKQAVQNLKIDISDAIQQNDIGFGYGSLAAGADILIAECLLEEGAELHIVLPVKKATFIDISVRPYGANWVKRFNKCLRKASSVRYPVAIPDWPKGARDGYDSMIAMGHAVMHAGLLASSASQLLIWDGITKGTRVGTGRDAKNWAAIGRSQIIIPYPGARKKPTKSKHKNSTAPKRLLTVLSYNGDTQTFADVQKAVEAALSLQMQSRDKVGAGIHFGASAKPQTKNTRAELLANHAAPGTILASENIAALLAAFHAGPYKTEYMGRLKDIDGNTFRAFSLRAINQ